MQARPLKRKRKVLKMRTFYLHQKFRKQKNKIEIRLRLKVLFSLWSIRNSSSLPSRLKDVGGFLSRLMNVQILPESAYFI